MNSGSRVCASQMTAGQHMDVLETLPRCTGQAADAVPLTPSQIGRRFNTIEKFPCHSIQTSWSLTRHKWPKSKSDIEEPIVPLERNLYWSPTFRIAVGNTHNAKTCCWKMDGNKHQTGNFRLCVVSKVNSCPCTWMTKNRFEGRKTSTPCRHG